MIRTSLDDAQWTSLMMAIQRIPHTWKRDEAALRRFSGSRVVDPADRHALARPAGEVRSL